MIYEYAGICGVNPDPMTLRELFYMARGRIKNEWGHTASLMALICNVNRGAKQKAFTPEDFMPRMEPKKDEIIHSTKLGFRVMKSIAESSGVITKRSRKK